MRDLKGPWLLFDNEADPFQQTNLVNKPEQAELQKKLDDQLNALLKQTGDAFQSAPELVKRCGYKVDKTETVGYRDPTHHGQVSVNCREK